MYGAGETFKCYENYFREFEKDNRIEIIGLADRSLQKGNMYCGFSVLSLHEIAELSPDYVVVTAAGEAAKSITSDLVNSGVSEKKIVNVISYSHVDEKLRKVDNAQLPVQLEIIKKLLAATDEEVSSFEWIGKAYDFVFIDADHSYDASMRDYMNLGQYAKKMTVFHDIYAHEYDNLNGGTVRMWNEVMDMTAQHKHHVFSEHPDEWMGIGVIEHSS